MYVFLKRCSYEFREADAVRQ